MKFTITLSILLLLANLNAQVKHIGSMSEMGKNSFKANVQLDSLLQSKNLYGLGPYGKMQGEITVVNGKPYTAYANDQGELKVKTDSIAQAPFFVYSYIPKWKTFEVQSEITDQASLQKTIQETAKKQGIDLTKPFPFRIITEIDDLTIHVVAPRSSDVPGYKEGITSYKFDFKNIQGEIIGFYSEQGQGVYTTKNSFVHLHFISPDNTKMGHIDAIRITQKQKLKIMFPESSKLGANLNFNTIDTDFSKGRLSHKQTIELSDLEKFHGHLCDGLMVGALAMQQAMRELYPIQSIDRTNLRIVSKPSPCLTDVAIYLTGSRYQFNTFYIDPEIEGIFIIQRMDNLKTVSVSLNPGVKPNEIERLGNLAVKQELSPCTVDHLKNLEDEFTEQLVQSVPDMIFTVKNVTDFKWKPKTKNDYLKTDIINKQLPECD